MITLHNHELSRSEICVVNFLPPGNGLSLGKYFCAEKLTSATFFKYPYRPSLKFKISHVKDAANGNSEYKITTQSNTETIASGMEK